jgi:BolA protein
VGPIEAQMHERLLGALRPVRMKLENESHRHRVPAGSESHWNLIIVADAFADKARVARQRAVFAALGDLVPRIHALTIKALTPQEWEAAGGAVTNPAPPCMGGGKGHG